MRWGEVKEAVDGAVAVLAAAAGRDRDEGAVLLPDRAEPVSARAVGNAKRIR